MRILHQDHHPYSVGPRWTVYQDPMFSGRQDLIRFLKMGQTWKFLDRTARWDGQGWDPFRWLPLFPQVPATLLAIVEKQLRGAA
jgi:hypothetical protein